MREGIVNRMGKPQVKANFSALPIEVCEKLSSATNTGRQNHQHLVWFYCNGCQKKPFSQTPK